MLMYQIQVPHSERSGYTAHHSRSSSRGHSRHDNLNSRASKSARYSNSIPHYKPAPYPSSGGGYYDPSRRRHYSTGHGGEYDGTPPYSHSQYRHSQPVHYTRTTPPHSSSRAPPHRYQSRVQHPSSRAITSRDIHVVDAGRRPLDTLHRRHSESSSWWGETFRRLFGGGKHHRPRSRSRGGAELIDTRSGKPVDRRGRPIYQV